LTLYYFCPTPNHVFDRKDASKAALAYSEKKLILFINGSPMWKMLLGGPSILPYRLGYMRVHSKQIGETGKVVETIYGLVSFGH